MLADDDERHEAEHDEADAVDGGESDHQREELGREDQHEAEQQTCRNEEARRVLEVAVQQIAAARTLGHEAQRQAHERAEGGLHGADVDRRAAEQEERERNHRGLPRSMSPSPSPPRARRRRSARAMRPPSSGRS